MQSCISWRREKAPGCPAPHTEVSSTRHPGISPEPHQPESRPPSQRWGRRLQDPPFRATALTSAVHCPKLQGTCNLLVCTSPEVTSVPRVTGGSLLGRDCSCWVGEWPVCHMLRANNENSPTMRVRVRGGVCSQARVGRRRVEKSEYQAEHLLPCWGCCYCPHVLPPGWVALLGTVSCCKCPTSEPGRSAGLLPRCMAEGEARDAAQLPGVSPFWGLCSSCSYLSCIAVSITHRGSVSTSREAH